MNMIGKNVAYKDADDVKHSGEVVKVSCYGLDGLAPSMFYKVLRGDGIFEDVRIVDAKLVKRSKV